MSPPRRPGADTSLGNHEERIRTLERQLVTSTTGGANAGGAPLISITAFPQMDSGGSIDPVHFEFTAGGPTTGLATNGAGGDSWDYPDTYENAFYKADWAGDGFAFTLKQTGTYFYFTQFVISSSATIPNTHFGMQLSPWHFGSGPIQYDQALRGVTHDQTYESAPFIAEYRGVFTVDSLLFTQSILPGYAHTAGATLEPGDYFVQVGVVRLGDP